MEIKNIIIGILLCVFPFYKPSVNEIKDVPENFKDWIRDNSDRIESVEAGKGTMPYFIKDNKAVVDEVLQSKVKPQEKPQEEGQDKTYSLPPHVEEYIPYNDGKFMVSPLHGKDELGSNLKLAQTMYDIFGETVYLLPNINPKGADANLRAEYIPEGVKKDKNADFLCSNRIWDGKECSFENTPREWKKIKSTLENHFKKAKLQADNYIIQVPLWLEEEMFSAIVKNYLSLSKKDRWIIICKENGYGKLYKNTIGQ